MELVPIDLATARAFVGQHHRHNRPPVGWKVGVGLADDGELVGVGILAADGLPKRPMFQEELTEILAAKLDGCEVTTRGVHSGVVTTVRCGVLR